MWLTHRSGMRGGGRSLMLDAMLWHTQPVMSRVMSHYEPVLDTHFHQLPSLPLKYSMIYFHFWLPMSWLHKCYCTRVCKLETFCIILNQKQHWPHVSVVEVGVWVGCAASKRDMLLWMILPPCWARRADRSIVSVHLRIHAYIKQTTNTVSSSVRSCQ